MKADCKCDGKGCAQCELKLKLRAKGPAMVYSSELKSTDPEVKPAFDKIPIVKLIKGQELELLGNRRAQRRQGACQVVPGLVYYKYKPEIEITGKCDSCGACVKACPVKVFEEKGTKLTINQDNLFKCHLCNACVEACPKDAVQMNSDKTKFIFSLESWDSSTARRL